MEGVVFKVFQSLFRIAVILMVGGTLVSVLADVQKKAFVNKKIGLISMLKINQQLVGKTK